MSDISYRISNIYTKLTQTEKKVANYIMENSNAIAFESLDNLALKIGVSTTSVIRLAKAMGYNGYAQMRQSIQEEMNDRSLNRMTKRLSKSDRSSDAGKLLVDHLNKNVDIIRNTFEGQKIEDLQDAVKSIKDARNVYLIGLSDSFSLAYNMAINLGQIRASVHLMQTVGAMFPMELQEAGSGDVCIAFWFPRYYKVTANVLTIMRRKGVKIILFTSRNTAPVEKYGDIILPCDISVISIKDSMIGPMCLSNYIADAVALDDYDKTMETLSGTEEIISYGYYMDH